MFKDCVYLWCMTQSDFRIIVQDIKLLFENFNNLLMIGIQDFVDWHLINMSDFTSSPRLWNETKNGHIFTDTQLCVGNNDS